jgi:hypothetical protein
MENSQIFNGDFYLPLYLHQCLHLFHEGHIRRGEKNGCVVVTFLILSRLWKELGAGEFYFPADSWIFNDDISATLLVSYLFHYSMLPVTTN